MLDDIEWDDISIDTLRTLVASRVPESERLDYKREVYGRGDNREIAKDISALANTQGGHLVLGISDTEGEPTGIIGLDGIDPDAEIRRMDEVLRTSVQPSITGVRFKPVRDGERLAAIVVRVPKSWRAPHQVVASSTYRFYGRRARSNAPLDVDALRALFSLEETIADRTRRFREERVALIISGRTPASVRGDALIIWHAIPLGAFALSRPLNIEAIASRPDALVDLCWSSYRTRRNIDGLLCLAPGQCYAQLFRSGIIEVVAAQETWTSQERSVAKIPRLDIAALTEQIRTYVGRSKVIARTVQAPLPLAMSITLTGMNGWQVWAQNLRPSTMVDMGFDRDVVIVPDHLVETTDQDDDHDAKPILDMIWQAAGWPEAKGFDENGKWTGRL